MAEAKNGEISLIDLCKNNVFIIPPEQREYVWKKENIIQLLEDILEHKNDPDSEYGEEGEIDGKYIGAVIALHSVNRDGKYNELQIFDGQQRITTLIIIMNVISRHLKRVNGRQISDLRSIFVNDHVFYTSTNEEIFVPLLTPHYDYEMDFLKSLVSGEHIGRSDTAASLYDAYSTVDKFIQENFEHNESGDNELLSFMNFIANNVQMTLVIRRSPEVARKVFLSLNSTGKALEDTDLIRGYLIGDKRNTPEEANAIKNEWTRIFSEFKGKEELYSNFILTFVNSIKINHKKLGIIPYNSIYNACFSKGNEIIGPCGIFKSSMECMNYISSYYEIYKRVFSGRYINRDNALSNFSFMRVSIKSIDMISLIGALYKRYPNNIDSILDTLARFSLLHRLKFLSCNMEIDKSRGFNNKDVKDQLNLVRTGVITGQMSFSEVMQQLNNPKRRVVINGTPENVLCSDIINKDAIINIIRHSDKSDKGNILRFINIIIERHVNTTMEENVLPVNNSKLYNIEHISPVSRKEPYTNQIGNFVLLEKNINQSASNKEHGFKDSYYMHSKLFITRLICSEQLKSMLNRSDTSPYCQGLISMFIDSFERFNLDPLIRPEKWSEQHAMALEDFYIKVLITFLNPVSADAENEIVLIGKGAGPWALRAPLRSIN